MADDYFTEHFSLTLILFCFQVLSSETYTARNWEFRLAVGALHDPFVVSSALARTYALGLLSMLLDLTVILLIVSACNEVYEFNHFLSL
jgi:hypothetical protein